MTVGKPSLSHQGKQTVLLPGESLIGSGTECAVRIQGQGVAAVHAAVTVEGEQVSLEDRSPDQETKVNDRRVSVVEIEEGQSVRFGEVELHVAREGKSVVLQGSAGRFSLVTGENKVGRAPDCRVQLEDGSISRYHATILVLPKKSLLKDLGSTNGSWVDDKPVGVVELESGDRIKLGEEELVFTLDTAAEATLFEVVVDGRGTVLTPGESTIGRAPDCVISFSDDAGVSRHHAVLVVGREGVSVRDLGSSNGTYVNGSPISGDTPLKNGDRIGIGAHELLFKAQEPVDPLGKTVLASDLGALGQKTVLMPKRRPAAAPPDQTAQAQGAWAVFDLSPGADEEQIRLRYQELFSEYQVRLTNAPTPKLKEKYSQKVDELRLAFAELVPHAAGSTVTDLPSARPVDAPKPGPAAAAKPPAPAAVPPPAPGQEPLPAEPAPPAAPSGRETVPSKTREPLPRSAFVMLGLGVLALALAVVMAVLFLGARKSQAELVSLLDEKTQSIARMQQEIVGTQTALEELSTGKATLLENRPFKVCNLSSGGELRILWLAAAFIDDQDQMASFDSASVGYPRWTVGAGGSAKFDLIRDDRVIWDGSALFFSMLFRYRGQEYFRSGAMMNIPDDCYKLALDSVG